MELLPTNRNIKRKREAGKSRKISTETRRKISETLRNKRRKTLPVLWPIYFRPFRFLLTFQRDLVNSEQGVKMITSSDFRYPDKPIETGPEVIQGLDPSEWICSAKYDGWRMPTYIHGTGNVECLTSTGNPMASACQGRDRYRVARQQMASSRFDPAIQEQIQALQLPPGSVLDAEFVGPRGHLTTAVYIFDVLAWEHEWLVREPFEQRWERCKRITLPTGGLLHHAETVESDFLGLFERLKAGWDGVTSAYLYEGIVVKARSGGMKLDRSRNQKSDVMVKLKFREIREARW